MGCFSRRRKPKKDDEDVAPLLAQPPPESSSGEDESSSDDDASSSDDEDFSEDEETKELKCWIHDLIVRVEDEARLARAFAGWTHRATRTALSTWIAFWEDRKRSLELIDHALRKVAHAKLTQSFASWDKHAAEHREYVQGLSRAARSWQSRGIATAMVTWLEFLHGNASFRRAGAHLRHRTLSAGFGTWAEAASEHGAQMESLRRGVNHLVHRELSRAWKTWIEVSLEVRDSLAAIERALHYATNQGIARGFGRWGEFVADAYAEKRALGHFFNRGLSVGWKSWLEYVGELEEAHASFVRVQRLAFRFMIHQGLGRAITTWREACTPDANLVRAATHLISQTLARGWREWYGLYEQFAKMRHAIRRIANRRLGAGWETWTTMVLESRLALQTLRLAAMRLANRQTADAFATWGAYAADHAEATRKLRKGLMMAAHSSVAHAFMSWQRSARSASEDPMVRAGHFLRNSGLTQAWLSWRIAFRDRQAASLKMQKGLQFMMRGDLARAMTTWADATARRHDPRFQSELRARNRSAGRAAAFFLNSSLMRAVSAWLELAEFNRKLRRGAGRLLHKQSAKAWDAWAARAEEMRAMRQGAAFFLNRNGARAMSAWSEAVERAHEQAECDEARRRVALYLMHRGLSKGVSSWRVYAEERLERMAILESGAKHLKSNGMTRVWNTWMSFVEQQISATELMRRTLGFVVARGMARGFASWAQGTLLRDDPVARAVRHFANAAFARGWSSWRDYADERAAKVANMERGLKRLVYRSTALALDAWIGMAEGRKEQMAVLRRGAGFFTNRSLALALSAWRRRTVPKQMFDFALRTRTQGLQRSIAHFTQRGLMRAVVSWHEHCVLLTKLRGAMRRLVQRELARSWNRWADHAGHKARLAALLPQILRRELVKGWNTWVGQFEALAGIRRAVRHLVNRHLSRGWASWLEMARYLKALRRGASFFVHRVLAQSWVVWMAFWAERALDRNRADSGRKRAIQRLKNMQCARAWTSWAVAAREHRKMAHALRRLTHRHLAYGWSGWAEMVAERHRLLRLVRKGTTFFLDRAVGLAFNAWRAEVERTLSEAYSDYAGYYYNPAMTGPVTPLREPDRPKRGVDAIPFWPVEDLPTEAPRPPLSKRCMPRCSPRRPQPPRAIGSPRGAPPKPAATPINYPFNPGLDGRSDPPLKRPHQEAVQARHGGYPSEAELAFNPALGRMPEPMGYGANYGGGGGGGAAARSVTLGLDAPKSPATPLRRPGQAGLFDKSRTPSSAGSGAGGRGSSATTPGSGLEPGRHVHVHVFR